MFKSAFISANFKDMLPIYSAQIIIKNNAFNELFYLLKNVATEQSLTISQNQFQLEGNNFSGVIELSNDKVSRIVANPLGGNEYKLSVRVGAYEDKNSEFLTKVVLSLENHLSGADSLTFKQTKIKTYSKGLLLEE